MFRRKRDTLVLGEVAKLELAPGDALVFHSEHRLTQEQVDRITKGLREVFPGHKVAVFDRGNKLSVATK